MALCLALGLSNGCACFSQVATGAIVGVVRDTGGNVVAGAKIELLNVEKGQVSKAVTDNEGYYSFLLLQPAHYQVTIDSPGFRQFRQQNITLNVATTLTVNATLQVGEVSQSVTVSSQPPPLELQTSSLGQVIGNKSIVDLPLNGRNSYGFVALVPGVMAPYDFSQTAYDEYTDEFISINGSGPSQSLFLLDGGINSSAAFNGPNYFPSVDLVQEYNVQTNNYSAEFPHSAGGIINVVTKSGSNQFHGAAWEFYRNTDLEANTFFSNKSGLPRSPFLFNQFGATAGGPIRRDKTFFFFGYEGIRWNQSGNAVGTLPTQAQRSGDFSTTYNANGQMIPIYDPFTTTPNPGQPGQYTRTQFPNNKIPAGEINPVATALLAYLPLPNQPGSGLTGANNYAVSITMPIVENSFSLRIDQAFSETQKLFGRYSLNDTTVPRPNLFGNGSPNYKISSPTLGEDFYRQQQATLQYTNALRPNLLLDLNSSFVRHFELRTLPGEGTNPTVLGLPSYFTTLAQSYIPCFPLFSATGLGLTLSLGNVGGGLAGESCVILRNPMQTVYQYGGLTIVHGLHTFKLGGNFGDGMITAANFTSAGPSFSFSPSFTQGPNPASGGSSGVAFASLLTGLGTGSTASGGSSEIVDFHYYGAYFQDDWRVTPRLTLNLGLRYDLNLPWTERRNRFTSWSFTAPSPLQVTGLTLAGGLVFPGVNGLPRGQFNGNDKEFQPRLGFSFQALSHTAVRGGFGIFLAPISGTGFNGNSVPTTGFTASTPWTSSLNGITPLYTLSNPFAQGLISPSGSSEGLSTDLGQSVVAMDRNRPNAYAEQWNFDVQQELPGDVLFDVAYAGSHGVHLYTDFNANQLPDQYLSKGNALNQLVTNPFYGLIASGGLSAATVKASQLLLPFPQFSAVTLGNSSFFGASLYDALEVKIDKRFSHGFNYLFAYTWSKLMTNVPPGDSGFPGSSIETSSIQDWDNLRGEWADADFDTTHYLAANGIYELPFGRDKRFLNSSRAADWIAGNWQLNGIFTLTSGTPLNVTVASNTLFNNGGTQRANWNGQNPRLSGPISKRLTDYFNVSDFSVPASFTYGNTSRTLSILRSPGYVNTDLSAVKNFRIHETLTAEFRAEAFNLFNHPRFGNPNTVLGSGTTGIISSQVNLPRQLQLAAKFVW